MSRFATTAIAVIFALPLAARPARAAEATSVGSLLHIVSDVNKSVAFYRTLFGVPENSAGRGAQPRQVTPDPELQQLYNLPGGSEGAGVVRVPGLPVSIEMVEWQGVARSPIERRIQDPGNVTLVLSVRDLDKTAEILRQIGARPERDGTIGTGAKTLLARDLDGFLVECVQAAPAPGAPAGNIVDARYVVTIDSTDTTLKFYRDVFGLTTEAMPGEDSRLVAYLGLLVGGEVRASVARVPDSPVSITFLEFKTGDRQTKRSKLPDPGTPILRIMVRNMETVVKSLKAGGGEIMAANGGFTLRHNAPITIARDPNNLYLEPMQPAPRP